MAFSLIAYGLFATKVKHYILGSDPEISIEFSKLWRIRQ